MLTFQDERLFFDTVDAVESICTVYYTQTPVFPLLAYFPPFFSRTPVHKKMCSKSVYLFQRGLLCWELCTAVFRSIEPFTLIAIAPRHRFHAQTSPACHTFKYLSISVSKIGGKASLRPLNALAPFLRPVFTSRPSRSRSSPVFACHHQFTDIYLSLIHI